MASPYKRSVNCLFTLRHRRWLGSLMACRVFCTRDEAFRYLNMLGTGISTRTPFGNVLSGRSLLANHHSSVPLSRALLLTYNLMAEADKAPMTDYQNTIASQYQTFSSKPSILPSSPASSSPLRKASPGSVNRSFGLQVAGISLRRFAEVKVMPQPASNWPDLILKLGSVAVVVGIGGD